jgi:hypothetical protein
VIPRRLAVLALAALLLGGTGVVVAVDRASDDGSSAAEEFAAGDSPITTTSSVVEPATTTTTGVVPAVTTTVAPARTATSSTTRRVTTTTARGTVATTTTARPIPPTSAGASPACSPDHLAAAITTDRHSYTPAQAVQVTSTLRNRSSVTCFYNGYRFGITFRNDAGATFGGVNVVADSFADVPLRAGETLTNSGSWDHRACPEPGCAALPPGPYYATATWSIASHTYDVLTSLILS